jgi:hypothetical protein
MYTCTQHMHICIVYTHTTQAHIHNMCTHTTQAHIHNMYTHTHTHRVENSFLPVPWHILKVVRWQFGEALSFELSGVLVCGVRSQGVAHAPESADDRVLHTLPRLLTWKVLGHGFLSVILICRCDHMVPIYFDKFVGWYPLYFYE